VICEVVVEVKLSWWIFNCWREFRGGWELFPEALRFPECFCGGTSPIGWRVRDVRARCLETYISFGLLEGKVTQR
jgi:hypothetical protein